MNQPFRELGGELKSIREQSCESLVEVSGAVEIETKVLELIEIGQERPSEDILMLLISHFDISDDDAVELWDLAGYDQPGAKIEDYLAEGDLSHNRQVIMMMALDTRILYSDNAQISADRNGVVLNFLQNTGTASSQQVPVSRIGMSYSQAQELSRVLHQTLAQAKTFHEPKRLSAPKPKPSKTKKQT